MHRRSIKPVLRRPKKWCYVDMRADALVRVIRLRACSSSCNNGSGTMVARKLPINSTVETYAEMLTVLLPTLMKVGFVGYRRLEYT
jgi:hypothetical protein